MVAPDAKSRDGGYARFLARAEDPTAIAATQSDPASLLLAVDGGRWALRIGEATAAVAKSLTGRDPKRDWVSERAMFEYQVANTLWGMGLLRRAERSLRAYFATSPERFVTPGNRYWFALAAIDAAELAHSCGDAEQALAMAARAQALTDSTMPAQQADASGAEAMVLIELGLDEAGPALTRQREAALRPPEAERDPTSLIKLTTNEVALFLGQRRFDRALQSIDRLPPDLQREFALLRYVTRLGIAELTGVRDPATERDLEAGLRAGVSEPSLRVAGELALLRAAVVHDQPDVLPRGAALREAVCEVSTEAAVRLEALMTWALRREHARQARPRADLIAQRARLDDALTAMLHAWELAPYGRTGVGFLRLMYRREVVTELVALTALCDGERAAAHVAVDSLLRLQHMTTLARSGKVPRVTLEDVRATFVRPGHGVLFVLPETRRSLAVFVGSGEPRRFELPSSWQIDAAAREALARLDQMGFAADRAAAAAAAFAALRTLGETLLTPELRTILADLDGLTIADHGTLHGLPWECLVHGEQLLGERWAINTLTSLPFGVDAHRSRYHPRDKSHLCTHFIATLLHGKELGIERDSASRELADGEWRALRAPYPPPLVLANAEATRTAVSTLPPIADITHFLGHGARDRDGRAPGLALTPEADNDGYLGSRDVEQRAWRGLVILSACSTGKTRRRVGDDAVTSTLGGAFLRAGAHTVIQSPAALHLATHVELMRRVHTRLVRGLSPAQALCATRAELARTLDLYDRLEHAQVQVMGLGHLPTAR